MRNSAGHCALRQLLLPTSSHAVDRRDDFRLLDRSAPDCGNVTNVGGSWQIIRMSRGRAIGGSDAVPLAGERHQTTTPTEMRGCPHSRKSGTACRTGSLFQQPVVSASEGGRIADCCIRPVEQNCWVEHAHAVSDRVLSDSEQRRSRTAGRAGEDEAGFVGEDDSLYSVAKPEFGEDSGDVRPDGCLGDHERLGDLGV